MIALAAILPGRSARADEPDSLFYDLQGSEVRSSRVRKTSPTPHSGIDGAELSRARFGGDITSVLALTPSVVATTETGIGIGGTSIRLRGSDATRINVTMNGVPMNNADSHAMYWYDTPDILSSVGSVQVSRGAASSSTFGTGAFGGAVSLASAPLSLKGGGDVEMSAGSFGTGRLSVHYGSGLSKGGWLFDVRGSLTTSEGYVDRGATKMGSYLVQAAKTLPGGGLLKYVGFGGRTKTYLTYTGVTKEEMALYGRTYHTSGQYVDPSGKFVLADGTRVSYFDDNTDNYTQACNQLLYSRGLASGWSVNAVAFANFGGGFYRQYKDDAKLVTYDNFAPSGRADLIRRKNMRSVDAGANLSAAFEGERLSADFGVSALCYRSPHDGTLDWVDGAEGYGDFVWYRNLARKGDGSLWGRTVWRPCVAFEASAAMKLRFVSYRASGTNDNYDSTTGAMQPVSVDRKWVFPCPEVGLSWAPDGNSRFGASFAAASKEPTRSDFTDRYMFSSLSSEPDPETLLDWELSYQYSGKALKAGVNLYLMRYFDQLVPTGIVNDSSDNLNINVPDSYRAGAELSIASRPCRWLLLDASATLSRNRILDFTENISGVETFLGDVPIAYSPSVLASAGATVSAFGAEAVLRSRYVGMQYLTNGADPDLSLPGYCVTDLDLGYELSWKQLSMRLYLKVANLFSEEYCSYGYGYSYLWDGVKYKESYYFPQATRNFLAGLRITF